MNGGKLLTPAEKDELDEWYIRSASLSLDARIIAMTIRVVLAGESRSARALAAARAARVSKREQVQESAVMSPAYLDREYARVTRNVRSH